MVNLKALAELAIPRCRCRCRRRPGAAPGCPRGSLESCLFCRAAGKCRCPSRPWKEESCRPGAENSSRHNRLSEASTCGHWRFTPADRLVQPTRQLVGTLRRSDYVARRHGLWKPCSGQESGWALSYSSIKDKLQLQRYNYLRHHQSPQYTLSHKRTVTPVSPWRHLRRSLRRVLLLLLLLRRADARRGGALSPWLV